MVRGITLMAVLLAGAALWAGEGAGLSGRVADENEAPLAGARIVLRTPNRDAGEFHAYTTRSGEYVLELPAGGEYLADIEAKGHFALRDQPLTIQPGRNEADFKMNRLREVFESVSVEARPAPINMETSQGTDTVTGTELVNIPYPSTNNLRNALRVVPGITQGPSGRLHINGAKEEQTFYTLNGFNIADPLTGRFESRLSVESVQTIDISSSLVSADYGKSSAGVLAVNTTTGDDKFRASATNFFPGVEYRKGLIIGNWTPRINFSGPIRRGRAWFSNSLDAVYVNTVIDELPKGEDRAQSWRFSDHLGVQVNLTPSNILHAGFLANMYTAAHEGLGVLDPRETTVDRRSRQWFVHLKDQVFLPNRILVEVGYAANRTFGREIPQGEEIYQITPEGRRGNFFLDAVRKASRDQVLANAFLPEFQLWGEHRLRGGVDLNRLRYWQDARRTGFENFGRDFIRTRRTVFGGSGRAEIVNYETSLYVVDSWRPRRGLLVDLGLRGDWDQILHYWNVSPRAGAAWQPRGLPRTKITGGFGFFYDATNLRIFTRPMDQYSLTTYFDEQGELRRGPALTMFRIDNARPARPRYTNWSGGIEQEFGRGVHARIEYLRRRGRYGFTYLNTAAPGPELAGDATAPLDAREFEVPEIDALYRLSNDRRDKYAHVRVTVRQAIRRKYEWLVSYTRSRARSNAVVDANIDEPLLVYTNDGPMPWDAPHRLVTWGYLPTPWKDWAVAYLAEWHSGFPFSIIDEENRLLGKVNEHRFPDFLELNLHLERRFALFGHLWALRAGCNNLTNHSNPNTVNNNVSSQNFLRFYGGADRSFNFRFRWLGRSPQ